MNLTNITKITRIIDNAIWTARDRHGHSDNGLIDYDTGEYTDDAHDEALEAAAEIAVMLGGN